jgi:hypothetical protein
MADPEPTTGDFRIIPFEAVDPSIRARFGPQTQPAMAASPATPQDGPGLSFAQRLIRQSAPSTIGGILGGAAGTFAAPFTGGIVNPVTGAMAGSALGELANQGPLASYTGAEPSAAGVGMAGLVPGAPAALRTVVKNVPGMAAGLQKYAQGKLGTAGETLQDIHGVDKDTLNLLWNRTGPLATIPVATTGTAKEVGKLGLELEKSDFAVSGLKALIGRGQKFVTRDDLASGTPGVTWDVYRTNLSHLGAQIRVLEKKGGQTWGAAKDIYRHMLDDGNEALKGAPAHLVERYRLAIEATKRKELGEFIKDAFTSSLSAKAGLTNLNFDGIATKMLRNRDILDRLVPKDEVDDILSVITRFAKSTPQVTQVSGEGLRGMFATERIAMGAGIGLTGAGMGLDLIPATGSGFVGIIGVEIASRLLSSPVGRASVAALADKGFAFDQIVSALGQGARAGASPGRGGVTSDAYPPLPAFRRPRIQM